LKEATVIPPRRSRTAGRDLGNIKEIPIRQPAEKLEMMKVFFQFTISFY
jgi:hypothetical protein